MVYAAPIGNGLCGLRPIRILARIDDRRCAQSFDPFQLFHTARGGDDMRAKRLRNLKAKERHAPGALDQNRLTRPQLSRLDQREPCGQPGHRQG